jgi:hypothetical protein
MIARRKANGDGGLEALRVLKRRLSDVVYRALITDLNTTPGVSDPLCRHDEIEGASCLGRPALI